MKIYWDDKLKSLIDNLPSKLKRKRIELDWVLTFLAVYLIHIVCIRYYVKSFEVHKILLHPIKIIPSYLFVGWDSVWYKNLFIKYDSFVFPPMYSFTLRFISFLFQFKEYAFEKSAVILNFISHIVIVKALYIYCKGLTEKKFPVWIVVFSLFFYPGHNTFFAGYTESFFLAITIIIFILRQKNKLVLASIIAGFACLLRTFAVFLVVALLLEQIFFSIRDKKIRWREIASVTPGCIIFLCWNVFVYFYSRNFMVGQHDVLVKDLLSLYSHYAPDKAYKEMGQYDLWIKDLLTYHVPQGVNPKWWTFKYLFFSNHKEFIYVWFSIIGAIYLFLRKQYLGFFYILLFYFSMIIYTYRPFAFSRYISAFFPCFLMIAEILKERPRLQVVVISSFVIISYYFQTQLFLGFLGEP